MILMSKSCHGELSQIDVISMLWSNVSFKAFKGTEPETE